jgi:hypothetical protein
MPHLSAVLERSLLLFGLAATLGGCERMLTVAALDPAQQSGQYGLVGAPVNVPPAVVVRDLEGRPVRGIEVMFQVTEGGGSLAEARLKTDNNGIARAGAWVLQAGNNTAVATVAREAVTGSPVTFTATGGPSLFNLELQYISSLTSSQRAAFDRAAARWQELIIGDVDDSTGSIPAASCGDNSPALMDKFIDDLLIFVDVRSIDGPGRGLARSGVCFLRNSDRMPVIGLMQFDADDIPALEARGLFQAVIMHEMAHVLGFGATPTWGTLIRNPSAPGSARDTSFSGPLALQAFDALGGSSYQAGDKVPVENTGGTGTQNAHWRESVLRNELMTGYANEGIVNPVSRASIAAFWDLGYQVNLSGAESYTLSLNLRAPDSAQGIDLGDDVLPLPIRSFGAGGGGQ